MSVAQADLQKQVLDDILRATGRVMRTENIVFEGNQIKLPIGTTIDDNITFLKQAKADQAEISDFGPRVCTFKVWDVANATSEALRAAFGAIRHYGTFLSPPKLVDIANGPHSTVQVPFGNFSVPALPDVTFSVTAASHEVYGSVGALKASGPKRQGAYIEGVFDLIERYLETHSLYRGKAFTDAEKPEFIDTDKIDPRVIIYAEEVQAQLEADVYSRILYPDTMKQLGVPFRSCILLEGDFGVGKTEALNLVAKEADENDVTFIRVPPDGNFLRALQTARMYAPAIVGIEDIDRYASAGEENDRIKEVLDAFDGQTSKLYDVMILLTTNFVSNIYKGMIRPGRIDDVISIGAPDAAGVRKLIEVRIADRLDEEINWDQVAGAMEGYLPAFIVEVTSKAMRHAVVREGGSLDGTKLTTDDLVNAAMGLRRQYEIHHVARTEEEEPELTTAMRKLLEETLGLTDPQMLGRDLRETIVAEARATRAHVEDTGESLAERTYEWHEEDKEHTTQQASRVIDNL
jgi:ATPase family associated with various cellular activities (AAA)